MKNLHLVLATLGMFAAIPATADEQRINVGVGELTCPSCSFTVAAAMRGVPTVEIVDFLEGETWGEGIYVVAYDDQAASPDMIINAVLANGYPAEVLQSGDS
ncbi:MULTISPECIES: periplasmic mercury ion-binding protein [Roseobacteraceae]|jgi:copper chaperone CopZ|uniref:periplasmic mercury ion-binding protein n=1 Tax=Roseobacteraceae TaxID=2854170 RepID=UPI000CB9A3F2|nr:MULTISPECIES: periplasmic mercury ion-binding protein [Roseobacteraceae]MBE1296722.1 periplasmic mercury ion-binding protein [Paracoccaceae bacterium]MCI5099923.1 periplasmic mercury ion-binding protein [Phaeobacter italicus]PKP67674.1 MAG: periplasmic mercury ion-binding protein [Alphaproteobacteria bacterium HGW-Alphaproteobacteria-8]